jgi:hypothetical protein
MLFNATLLLIPCSPSPRLPAIWLPEIYITTFSALILTIPPSLTPTPLQSSLPHYPYIDLIPFPSFRDKLLKAGDVVDGHET